MADATMELVERIEGMIDTSASYDAMGITRVCHAAMSEAYDAGRVLGVALERGHADRLAESLRANEWGGLCINESGEVVGESCPDCGGLHDPKRAYDYYTAGHSEGCRTAAALAAHAAIRAGEVRG